MGDYNAFFYLKMPLEKKLKVKIKKDVIILVMKDEVRVHL